MKGPNERGREDSKNAIFDDLDTQNFRSQPPSPLSLSSFLHTPLKRSINFFLPFRYGSEKGFQAGFNWLIKTLQKKMAHVKK